MLVLQRHLRAIDVASLLFLRCWALTLASGRFMPPADFEARYPERTRIRALSWNVAAVNNNPFEYWITHPNPKYKDLMQAVERFIEEPGDDDVRIDQVFTDTMFERLLAKMEEIPGLVGSGLDTVRSMWKSTYRSRRVVSGFLKDGEIGKKRLASMPDRVTNTIRLASGSASNSNGEKADNLVFRPTVINCFEKNLASVEDWFEQWLVFFFDYEIKLDDTGKGRRVYTLLQQIKQKKYPAITLEEEAVSIPLQLVLQGVFDAVLVNLMLKKGGDIWEGLRRDICNSLNSRKNERILEILMTTYKDADVIFLQEAGNQLLFELKNSVEETYHIAVPSNYAENRNQNSVILMRRSLFASFDLLSIPANGWDAGDLLAVKSHVHGDEITLASFHGDTNGLLTVPCVEQVMKHLPTNMLLFGLDANTHVRVSESVANVLDFEKVYSGLGLRASWGHAVNVSHYTTFNARTYLQPQLNKAAKSTELALKGDQNPKDFILFTESPLIYCADVWRDNTGKGEYIEDMVFPTLDFPSDHAAIAADLIFEHHPSEEDINLIEPEKKEL